MMGDDVSMGGTVHNNGDEYAGRERIEIDHVDIVTSHICNKGCEHCIDAFLGTSNTMVNIELVEKFLMTVRDHVGNGRRLTVLLLGGEPTVLGTEKLIKIADVIHSFGYKASMSTNGILMRRIEEIAPYFDSVQVTIDELDEMEKWRHLEDKINLKICGDEHLTMQKLRDFMRRARGFQRRSVTMYFTENFEELCRDKDVWEFLDGLAWERSGSYMYAFYEDEDGHATRFKKCIPEETNIVEEPTIPKLYPNGNYNKTWRDEELDDYLAVGGKRWRDR